MSLAANPMGFISNFFPTSNKIFQIPIASLLLQYISNPPDPVYPVVEMITFLYLFFGGPEIDVYIFFQDSKQQKTFFYLLAI